MTSMWDPITIGRMRLPQRITMSPMTRSRALDDGTPSTMAVDYYAQGASLARIHLDPPAAVPARGDGRWLSTAVLDVLVSSFEAARVGQPGGLSMIELRHTDSRSTGFDGALTAVPAPFLLHAVGGATDDEARRGVDDVLRAVETSSRSADVGRSAPSFREGQPGRAMRCRQPTSTGSAPCGKRWTPSGC